MTDTSDKAALYKLITSQSNDWAVVERMRELGFWPSGQALPEAPVDEATERAKIEGELGKLRAQHATIKDPQKALQEERIRRWQESKARRAETKKTRLEERALRRAAWEAKKKETVAHAGLGVSEHLAKTGSNAAELDKRGLPVIHDAVALAAKMGISLTTLRWLTYHRRASAVVHYHRYAIPKKTGGTRAISAPKKALASAQEWVLDMIVGRLETEPEAHGFVRHRSIVTNASPHVGRRVVVNLDLENFFPTVSFRRVRGLFEKIGYGGQVATLLALVCTEPPRAAAVIDGKVFRVALGDRMLPQGACTSPGITNAICRKLDRRLAGLAKRHGFTYTRYADDLTFSGDKPEAIGALLRSARSIVSAEGFVEHPRKTRVMRRSRRQEVTGVSVNRKLSIPRDELRELRAILHNVAKRGLASQNRESHPDFAAYLRGRVAFACMVDPDRAPKLRAALARALT